MKIFRSETETLIEQMEKGKIRFICNCSKFFWNTFNMLNLTLII